MLSVVRSTASLLKEVVQVQGRVGSRTKRNRISLCRPLLNFSGLFFSDTPHLSYQPHVTTFEGFKVAEGIIDADGGQDVYYSVLYLQHANTDPYRFENSCDDVVRRVAHRPRLGIGCISRGRKKIPFERKLFVRSGISS